jgi:hypothetical protein
MLVKRLRRDFAKSRPRRSVFYSLAPNLGKRRQTPFLRTDCRQLRATEGNFQAGRRSLLDGVVVVARKYAGEVAAKAEKRAPTSTTPHRS